MTHTNLLTAFMQKLCSVYVMSEFPQEADKISYLTYTDQRSINKDPLRAVIGIILWIVYEMS